MKEVQLVDVVVRARASSLMATASTISRMSDAHSDTPNESADRVSAALKSAFAEVANADIDGADKGRWQRRLIAITNTAKHEVTRADEQLVRFRDEWNMFRRGKDEAR
jgi:hypothetical protein